MVIPDHIPVGPIAEGRISRVLAITQLIISTLRHVVRDRPAASHCGVAGTVAAWVRLGQAARAPGVHLAGLQVPVVWEET